MQSKRYCRSLLFCPFSDEATPAKLAPGYPMPCSGTRGVLLSLQSRWLVLALILSAIGCGGAATTPPPQDTKPFDGVTLKIASPAEPAAVLKQFAPGWARRNGARVEVAIYDPMDLPSSVEGADAWLVPPWRLGAWAASGDLAPVPETVLP